MDGHDNIILAVAMRLGDTPVLIPNTMVKTYAADGTMLETAWESRWLPHQTKKTSVRMMNIESWYLPVIRVYRKLCNLMTDKTQSQGADTPCSCFDRSRFVP